MLHKVKNVARLETAETNVRKPRSPGDASGGTML